MADEGGAVLVQVAIAILVLTAMATFVVDHGVVLVSRGQAQNAADAGALSGAIARSYDELTDPPASNGKAFSSAMGAALANTVWTAAPTAQVSWNCPVEFVGGRCVRVDVYRNGEFGSTALPTIFGKVLNISSQGVRATATAVAATANKSSNCLRPWMIPDKWMENTGPSDKFNGADVYAAPDPATGLGGTGFKVPQDIGAVVTLHPNSGNSISPSDYFEIDLDGTGGANYRENIQGCSGVSVSIGDTITGLPGAKKGPTKAGVDALVARDPGATWNGTAVVGSAYGVSPRIVPIAMFSAADYASMGYPTGRFDLHVVNILGFFVQAGGNQAEVTGVLVATAGELNPNGPTVGSGAGFLKKIELVR
jgi:hypothetical protein